MRAGFGISDLTPPLGVELAGYGYFLKRQCTSVRDPLHARAVMLEDHGVRQLIISCELLGLSQQVADDVIESARALGCTPDRVMIVSVHTHTGPAVIYHEGCGEVNDAYVATLARRIFAAAHEAARNLAPVTDMTFTSRELPGDYLYNRAAADGPVDRTLRGFLLLRGEEAPIALVSAACHGVFLGRRDCISADFSGAIDDLLEEKGLRVVYLNGLCGDIDPWQPSEERMNAFARITADAFWQGHRPLPLTVTGGRLPFTIRLSPVTREDIFSAARQAEIKAGGADQPAARVAQAWEQQMLSRFENLPTEESYAAAYCVLGGVPILALPFEGFTDIGNDFRRRTGCSDALVLGCAEELRGYVPTRDDIARGSYAALESTFLYHRLPLVSGEAERISAHLADAYQSARP